MARPVGESSIWEEARRAPRYAIVAPVRFRTGDGDWLDGTTVDMGRLGLLIRTAAPAPPRFTRLELRVALMADGIRRCAHVACTGRVVRADPSPVEGETLVAVTIDEFQLRPAGSDEEE